MYDRVANPSGSLENDPSLPIVIKLQTGATTLDTPGIASFSPEVYDIGNVWPIKNVTKHANNNPTKYIRPFISWLNKEDNAK